MSALELERKRLEELAVRASRMDAPCFTKFLEPALERDCVYAASKAGVQAAFFGGCEGAERRVAAFFADDEPSPEDYPIACVRLAWNKKYADPGHRDILGALMGLGIVRESLGDIAIGEGEAHLFALEEIATYIQANLESAGRAKLKAERVQGKFMLPGPEGTLIRETIPSERLDAVLAAGYNLSRAQAQNLIRSGHVKLNHIEEVRPDAKLSEGDLISARGYGRLKIEQFLGQTRRGRCAVQLFRYRK